MPFDWFRMYHEARTDNKLKALRDDEHRVWFDLLCFAAEQEERGTIPPMHRERLAAEVARGDEELLARTIERLKVFDIISIDRRGAIRFINWEKRQYGKPSQAPERVRERVARHRQRQRNAHVTPGNALGNADETRGNALDPDTDTDPEIVPSTNVEGVSPNGSTRAGSSGASKEIMSRPTEPPPATEYWAPLCEIVGYTPKTKTERDRFNAAIKHIRTVRDPLILPSDLRMLAERFHERMPPGTSLTPMSLAGNLGRLLADNPARASPRREPRSLEAIRRVSREMGAEDGT